MDASKDGELVEDAFKAAFPSLELFRYRTDHRDLCVSLRDTNDFLSVIRAASGVNIALEVGWLFDTSRAGEQEIGSCFLRLIIGEKMDERLDLFFLEVKRLQS